MLLLRVVMLDCCCRLGLNPRPCTSKEDRNRLWDPQGQQPASVALCSLSRATCGKASIAPLKVRCVFSRASICTQRLLSLCLYTGFLPDGVSSSCCCKDQRRQGRANALGKHVAEQVPEARDAGAM